MWGGVMLGGMGLFVVGWGGVGQGMAGKRVGEITSVTIQEQPLTTCLTVLEGWGGLRGVGWGDVGWGGVTWVGVGWGRV